MQKAKNEDFRVEEELRAQKAKYEEMSEDVLRRMQDVRVVVSCSVTEADCSQIKEAEADSVSDLGAFLDAELSYYERCREVLLQLKKDWPAGSVSTSWPSFLGYS